MDDLFVSELKLTFVCIHRFAYSDFFSGGLYAQNDTELSDDASPLCLQKFAWKKI